MKEVVIVSACRTAIGKFGGGFKNTPAVELGAVVIKEALKRAGIEGKDVDEVVMGNVLQAVFQTHKKHPFLHGRPQKKG